MRPVPRDPYADLPAVPDFRLTSSTVADGATIPLAQCSGIFGAGGQDQSPELSWAGFPDSTQSFIVSMYDPDAPTPSGFWHWAVVDIPVGVTALGLGAGEADASLPAGRHITNDGGLRRYLGAAPPPGPRTTTTSSSPPWTCRRRVCPTLPTPHSRSSRPSSMWWARAQLVPRYCT
jgi:phosphatidylethanolamine-binding protein (PEBP) family uncharacterized protein